jgi:16S rRNA (guanine527-N7)-methyltransferase
MAEALATRLSDLAADRAKALALVPVSRETAARLDRFVEVLLRWQRTTNLIASSTIPELWTRHIADSLQLLDLAPDAKVWIDFGAGGGFPGMAIACALAGQPGTIVHLVESNQKKAAFLREAARESGAPAVLHPVRIEEFVQSFTERADVVTARGLAAMPELVGYVDGLLKKGAKALFLKGQDVDAELTAASKYWNIQVSLVPSKTSRQGRIVVVTRADARSG